MSIFIDDSKLHRESFSEMLNISIQTMLLLEEQARKDVENILVAISSLGL